MHINSRYSIEWADIQWLSLVSSELTANIIEEAASHFAGLIVERINEREWEMRMHGVRYSNKGETHGVLCRQLAFLIPTACFLRCARQHGSAIVLALDDGTRLKPNGICVDDLVRRHLCTEEEARKALLAAGIHKGPIGIEHIHRNRRIKLWKTA